jgi:hypothetical protein
MIFSVTAGPFSKPTILTPDALTALKERIKMPPDDGGLWTGPKIARWLARFHGVKAVHDQRGWDALIAVDYSIQQPRPRHPEAASEADRSALKKSFSRLGRRAANESFRSAAQRRGVRRCGSIKVISVVTPPVRPPI